jgi:UDPglucose--hexose-1-phosphate uridylyltransferase
MEGTLPQLRTDWLLGRSVLVAENRAGRPKEFGESFDSPVAKTNSAGQSTAATRSHVARARDFDCPFCRGQEHRTPVAVFELADDAGQWRTRVVPNMFPAVAPGGEVDTRTAAPTPDEPLPIAELAVAIGVHEVIIESPRHVDRMSRTSACEIRGVLETYAQRLQYWRNSGRFTYGLIFRNQGARAGASLAHVHSQFIALPAVPPTVTAESDRAARSFHEQRACPYCRLVERERAACERMVSDSDGFVAFCPFASLQPYEVWLLPAEHEPFFEDLPSDRLDRLANILLDLARRVEAVAPESAHNLLLRTSPWQVGGRNWHHWRIEILPRTSAFAGFELATGMFINSVAPERAASKLRSI